MSVSTKSTQPATNIPLPTTPPPPPPPGTGTVPPASYAYPPPTNPAAYQQYIQQYYQYMYSTMYSNPAYAGQAAAAAAMQNYYNYNPTTTTTTTAKPPAAVVNTPTAKPAVQEQTKSQIKINLKFQSKQENSETGQQVASVESVGAKPRKSRFSTAEAISNVTAEQSKFKETQQKQQQQQTQEEKMEIEEIKPEEPKSQSNVSDIVFDINKWPAALKNYCAKVYQHYQQVALVSEDQVTKYLQNRITDAFKLKPDLNIGWESEPMPDINAIRKVAPFSQQQIKQQQRQQQLKKQQQIMAQQQAKLKQEAVNAAQAAVKPKFQSTLMSSIKENVEKKRKNRSRSSSSSGESESASTSSTSSSSTKSSSEDENFISLSNKKKNNKNLKRKSNDLADEIDADDLRILDEDRLGQNDSTFGANKKLNRKQRRQMLMQQKKQQHMNTLKSNNSNSNFLISRKFNDNSSLAVTRKTLKNIYELAKEQIDENEQDEAMHAKNICVGFSQDLEKEYLRLTGPPEPYMVRPLEVLKRSLDYVLMKYNRTNNYKYIWEQMKSIRQDLTVQQIRNEFTIQVYETHARIAIKNKDRDEFNQCQNQLKSLYKLVSSKEILLNDYEDNSAEFLGYRLLYNMLTKSYKDIDQVVKEIKENFPLDKNLKHLLELKQAWYLNNYIKFFKLYKKSDELSKCLIDLFVERERKQALKAIIKSFRPSIKLDTVSDMLAYESVDKCKNDLIEYKINLIEDKSSPNSIIELYIDCKSSSIQNF